MRVLKEVNQESLNYRSNSSTKELKEYVKSTKKDNIYKTNVDIKDYDGIITLVTCTRIYGAKHNTAAMIIDGRLVRTNERLKNYPVSKTDNYKKLENVMKGDGVNA